MQKFIDSPKPGLVAIVGRPNVGKSTLFNRLVGKRRAIVGDEPGITRDRLYGVVNWASRRFRVVDTGGIIPEDKELIPAEIFRQAKVALEECAAIVMVCDLRTELSGPDYELARLMMRSGKKLFLAVNKVDAPQLAAAAENFRVLGFTELYPISAEHGTGVSELLDGLLEEVPSIVDDGQEDETHEQHFFSREKKAAARQQAAADAIDAAADVEGEEVEPGEEDEDADFIEVAPEDDESDGAPAEPPAEIKVAIIGKPNVGKSTLINQLTGKQRSIVSPIAGTTRDAIDELVERDGQKYRLIDTAGIRRKGKTELMAEKLSVVMARKHLESADVALVVIDATQGVTALDANIAGYAHEAGRSVIVVVNKWDLMTTNRPDDKPPAEQQAYEEKMRRVLKFLDFAPIVFTSAESGKNVQKLYTVLKRVAGERRKRVSTGQMNRFLKKIDFDRATTPARNKLKIYYMTQSAVAPPTFVLFTDRDVPLHFSYSRFIENQVRDAFGFEGTPIWLKTRPKKRREFVPNAKPAQINKKHPNKHASKSKLGNKLGSKKYK